MQLSVNRSGQSFLSSHAPVGQWGGRWEGPRPRAQGSPGLLSRFLRGATRTFALWHPGPPAGCGPGLVLPLLALPGRELPRVSVIVFHEHVEGSRWGFPE